MVKHPEYSGELRNLYWMLRYYRGRSSAARRRYYRYIEAEKNRLFLAGFDKKEILLLCRYLANPRNIHAKSAFLAYAAQYRLEL
jgi:hypothetical protein